MGLYGCITEKFLNDNIGKKIQIRIRDVPINPGTLLNFSNGDILIKTDEGKRILIDVSNIIGIEEI